ncbi:MAG: hypothetical protein ACRBCT_09310 [Alphaproteobacteria bacterium]
MNVAGTWNGKIYGTNTGNVSIQLTQTGNRLEGKVRLMDDAFGVVVYDATGEANDNVNLHLNPVQFPEGIEVRDVTVTATLNERGHLQGEWESELGTGGTFLTFPHGSVNQPANHATAPEQLYNKSVPVGSVRLYGDDIEKLIQAVQKDFVQGRAVITYDFRGHKIIKYAEDFLKEIVEIDRLKALTINIQEPESNGINRSVTIELAEFHGSVIRVSSPNETWVIGKAETLKKIMQDYESSIVTNYRKYGLDFNFIIFLLMLVVMPEIENWPERLGFVLGVFTILSALLLLHRKFIPNTIINKSKKNTGWLKRIWPSILSWVMTTGGALIAGLLLHLFTGGEVFGLTNESIANGVKFLFETLSTYLNS